MPQELARSADHSALAVLVWATYETLMPRALGGGRAPAYARRVWLATRYQASERAVDDARRELVADAPGGPWLRRSRVQGAKRASRHAALRLPEETGEPYVAVPAWTMDLVHAGRGRPAGAISPDAWRLYVRALDKARVPVGRDADGQDEAKRERSFETSMAALGRALMDGASAATARRRVRELEAAGLLEVAERPGGSIVITVHTEPGQAERAAHHYAEHGRQALTPRPTPFQQAPFTPAKKLQSPLPGHSSPQKAEPGDLEPEESSKVPAVGANVREVAPARVAAGAAGSSQSSSGSCTPQVPRQARKGASPDAVRLVRRHMPRRLLAHVPEHGLRRLLRTIDEELAHRTVDELVARIERHWEGWRWRPEEIQDHTAMAITMVRRGYDCPDVRCELGLNLDTGHLCQWCEQNRTARNAGEAGDTDHDALSAPQTPEHAPMGGSAAEGASEERSQAFTPPPVASVLAAVCPDEPDPDGPGHAEFRAGLAAMKVRRGRGRGKINNARSFTS